MLRPFLILMTLVIGLPAAAQNSCEFANDNECDELRYGGQGFCDTGTDTDDCSLISASNSCVFANDTECDEFRFGGTGACQDGSDATDCSAWIVEREATFLERANELGLTTGNIASLGDNTCRWNNDGECDDLAFGGTGACQTGTDATDCIASKPN